MAVGQLTASSAIMLPLSLLIDRPWSLASPSLGGWASLLSLALLSTGFAYLMFFRLLARIGAVNLVLVTFLVPISALLLDTAVLGEAVRPGRAGRHGPDRRRSGLHRRPATAAAGLRTRAAAGVNQMRGPSQARSASRA